MNFLGPNTVPILVAAAATLAVLGLGGALTEIGEWYANLRKPSWQPPNWLFAPAWSTIGVFTAWSAVDAWTAAPGPAARTTVVVLCAVNGALNLLWSPLFFKLRRPDWALIEVVPLWLSVAAMMAAFAPYSSQAAWLLTPYLAWVSFAAFLNLTIVRLNQPFGRLAAPHHSQTGA